MLKTHYLSLFLINIRTVSIKIFDFKQLYLIFLTHLGSFKYKKKTELLHQFSIISNMYLLKYPFIQIKQSLQQYWQKSQL